MGDYTSVNTELELQWKVYSEKHNYNPNLVSNCKIQKIFLSVLCSNRKVYSKLKRNNIQIVPEQIYIHIYTYICIQILKIYANIYLRSYILKQSDRDIL